MGKFIFVLVFLLTSHGALLSQTQEIPTAKKLIQMAPRISLDNKNITSFLIEGYLDFNGLQFQFIVSGQQPDQLALRILDSQDNTPILAGMNNRVMFYDPISVEAYLSQAVPNFIMKMEKVSDDLNLKMFFGLQQVKDKKEKTDKARSTVVDLGSIAKSLEKDFKITFQDQEHIAFSGCSKKGGLLKAIINPADKQSPYCRVELYEEGKKKPAVVLSRILLNRPLPEKHFVFPEKELNGSKLPKKEISDAGAVSTMLTMGKLFRAVMTRLSLSNPEDKDLKEMAEKMCLIPPNWDRIKKEDPINSALLRSLFKKESWEVKTREKN